MTINFNQNIEVCIGNYNNDKYKTHPAEILAVHRDVAWITYKVYDYYEYATVSTKTRCCIDDKACWIRNIK